MDWKSGSISIPSPPGSARNSASRRRVLRRNALKNIPETDGSPAAEYLHPCYLEQQRCQLEQQIEQIREEIAPLFEEFKELQERFEYAGHYVDLGISSTLAELEQEKNEKDQEIAIQRRRITEETLMKRTAEIDLWREDLSRGAKERNQIKSQIEKQRQMIDDMTSASETKEIKTQYREIAFLENKLKEVKDRNAEIVQQLNKIGRLSYDDPHESEEERRLANKLKQLQYETTRKKVELARMRREFEAKREETWKSITEKNERDERLRFRDSWKARLNLEVDQDGQYVRSVKRCRSSPGISKPDTKSNKKVRRSVGHPNVRGGVTPPAHGQRCSPRPKPGERMSLVNSPPKLGSSSPNLRPNGLNRQNPAPVSPLMLDSGFGDSGQPPDYEEYDE